MTFLNSIFLFALGAVLIPLLIHLFSRQRVKTIHFSSLDFLKLLQRQKMRRVRLRQLILLLLRTLIVLFVILAFARPALKGVLSAGLSTRARTSAVLLLDTSFSMGLRTPKGLLFDLAKEKAIEIVDLLSEGDEAWFLLAARVPDIVLHTQDFTLLRRTIAETDLSSEPTNIRGALLSAMELLAKSKNANKEIYLITDMQRTGWQGLLQGKAFPSSENIGLFLLPLVDEGGGNVSIDRVEFLDRLLEAGKPFNLQATVTNHSEQKKENLLMQLYVDGKRIGQTALDVEAGRTSRADFAAVFERPGQVSGYVEIEEDDLALDDRRYFAIRVPEKIRVLVVARAESDAHYLKLALNPYETSQSFVFPTVTSVDRLSQYALNDFDVILLANVPRLSSAQLSRLEKAIESGRGGVILLGNDIDPRFYNSQLLPTLCPATLRSPIGTIGEKSSFLTFGTMDFDHPLFKGVLSEKSKIESPNFYLAYDVSLSPATEPIISYSNGKVALGEARKGAGRTMLFSTAADPEWSNLWRKGIYVPLLYRIVQYLATDLSSLEEHILVGSVVKKEIGNIEFGKKIVCVEPDGEEQTIEPQTSGSSFVFEYQHTANAGIYKLLSGEEHVLNFAVNVDPSESDLAKIEDSQVEEAVKGILVHRIHPDQSIEKCVLQARYGRELWKHFLLIALILMCIEMLIAKENRRNRSREKQSSKKDV